MGFLVMVGFWLAVGFLLRSWWTLVGPVAVALFVLGGIEFVSDFEERPVGDLLAFLGGDQEFWFITFWVGLPFFLLSAGVGHQLREHLHGRRGRSVAA